MKTLIGFSILLLFCLAFSGCEGKRCGNGIVIDKSSKKPLDSVYCEVTTGNQTLYTDSSGKFNLCNPFGGCMPCKNITVRFAKDGYKTVEVENPVDAVVALEK